MARQAIVAPAWRPGQTAESTIRDLNAIFRNAPVSIIITSQRRIVKANPEFCRTFQYDELTALTLSGRDLFPSNEIYEELGRIAAPRLSRGVPLVHETEMIRGNGKVFWAQLTAYVMDAQVTDQGTIWMITDRSEIKRHADATRQAMLENQVILDSAAVGIVYLKNRIVERCNPKAAEIFGYPPGELVGTATRRWYTCDEDYQRVAREIYPRLIAGQSRSIEQTMLRSDGSPFWGRLSGQVLDPDNPIGGHSIWVVEDLSERHAAEQELVRAKALLQAVFDSATVSIIVTDATGVIQMMNRTACSWLGYEASELVGEATPRVFHDPDEVVSHTQRLNDELGLDLAPGFDTFIVKARMFGSDDAEWSYIRKDGSRFPVSLTTSVLRDGNDRITGYIGVAIDITDRVRADNALRMAQTHLEERVLLRTAELAAANQKLQREISHRRSIEEKMRTMAHYDELTGLPNRNLLNGRLDKAFALARRKGTMLALMFIDLDHFKWVNDQLGHDAGDTLLRMVATRMSGVIRDSDTLTRHGGDEFVLLLPEFTHRQELVTLADRLIGVFADGFEIAGTRVRTSPSIGIAIYPDDADQPDGLLRKADHAMYDAKTAGKNCFRFFST